MSEPNPFEPFYRRAGAALAAGEIPPSVAGFEEEYRAATEGALALDRSHRGAVRVAGRDREAFLQNMLSNNVRSIPTWAGVPAVFLTSKGKLVSDLLVFQLGDHLILEMERERVEPLRRALDRYVVSEDVVLENLVSKEVSFSVEGPKASELLGGLSGRGAPELDALRDLQTVISGIEGVPVRVTAHRRELTPRFDVSVPAERAAGLLGTVLDRGVVLGGKLVSEARRIEASRPRFGVDIDESHLPLEAGLDEALDFHKGCYIGQEYVVRLAHRGHVNRKLMGLRIEGGAAPTPGTPVRKNESEVGAVTSSTRSPAFGCGLALAFLRRVVMEPGTSVTVGGEGVLATATVETLPFNRDRS